MSYNRSNYSKRSGYGKSSGNFNRHNRSFKDHAVEPRDCGAPTTSTFYGVIHCENGRYSQYKDVVSCAKVRAAINREAGHDVAIGFARGDGFFTCV